MTNFIIGSINRLTIGLLFVGLIVFVELDASPAFNTKEEKNVDVLILGAGCAGIGAANILDKTNLSYLIIEGSDRVGGRIRTEPMTNVNPKDTEKVLVSAGAQWLHGRMNPLYTYAKNKGLVVFDKSQEENGVFVRDDGYEYSERFAEQIEGIVDDILDEADDFWYDKNATSYPASLDEFLTARFIQEIQNFTTDNKLKARQLLDWHKRTLSVDSAAGDFKKISAKHWGRFKYIGFRWEHISLKNGFAEVLELMAEDLGMDKFVLNKVVEKVDYSSEKNILVRCTDGTVYTAKHVIVTFSTGVLKHDADKMFVPALPQKHKEAINCLGFGPMTKLILSWETKWWGDELGLQLAYRDNDHEEATNFLRYISGFDLIYTGPPNTMVGWVTQKGVELMEKLSDKEIIDAVMGHVAKFLGPVPYPKRYFVSRWLNNPLTRGSYSHAHVDCDKNNITPDDLAAKITSPNNKQIPLLQFAGEGASQFYYSTAHGAYISGEDAAKEIQKYYKK